MATGPIASVSQAQATIFNLLDRRPFYVGAIGTVSSGGYTNAALTRRLPFVDPADGMMEFDFVADAPTGSVHIQVNLPISAVYEGDAPGWVKGERIISNANSVEAQAISTLVKPTG